MHQVKMIDGRVELVFSFRVWRNEHIDVFKRIQQFVEDINELQLW